ncbi:MAG: exopolyphosphatase [Flavobacteriaceae bacterium]|nr:exopolyphosphatase [Flavobacteriaceae bacterium]|tara:strand:+ start:7758 stop:8663 length:906 start_codon:yes stop_codon:yes gene_type:complete
MKIYRYAAIDVGSNAIRMLISNVIIQNKKTFIQKNSLIRLPIRLGEDSFTKGYISESKILNLIDAFKSFKLIMKIHNILSYKVYGTSALRESKNSHDIVNRVFNETKIKIEIIDGIKEAMLISKTNIFKKADFYKLYLYVDVGGGSTELSIIKNSKKVLSKSFKLGTVRLIKSNKENKEWENMKKWIKENLNQNSKVYIIGTGGNINKIHKLTNTGESKPITFIILNSLFQKLNNLSYNERIINWGLNPDRSDVIIPAMRIYLNILSWSGSKVIFAPQAGLTDGMIREIIEIDDIKIPNQK